MELAFLPPVVHVHNVQNEEHEDVAAHTSGHPWHTLKATRSVAHTLRCQPIQTADKVCIVIADHIYFMQVSTYIKLQIRLAQ